MSIRQNFVSNIPAYFKAAIVYLSEKRDRVSNIDHTFFLSATCKTSSLVQLITRLAAALAIRHHPSTRSFSDTGQQGLTI